ncbi:MAG TPA: hypothetical protein PLA94_19690 [Myxococcota bacterium]|nr:hypothetical protein [Myxococcota bacterium]
MFALLLMLACDGGPKLRSQTLTDQGTVCLNDGMIQVNFPGCLSSSCDTVVESSCSATYADGVVTVHASVTVEREGDICTDDCGAITATCELPAVDNPDSDLFLYAGEYSSLGVLCEGF